MFPLMRDVTLGVAAWERKGTSCTAMTGTGTRPTPPPSTQNVGAKSSCTRVEVWERSLGRYLDEQSDDEDAVPLPQSLLQSVEQSAVPVNQVELQTEGQSEG